MVRFHALMGLLVAAFAAMGSLTPVPAQADPAVELQVVIQPRNGASDARPIAIDPGDPVTLGSQIALIVKATTDATVNIRYLPSDGQPAMLAQNLTLKAGETTRLPKNSGNWYQISSGNGQERMIAEDASGAQLASVAYRIVQSAPAEIGKLAPGSSSQSSSAGGVDLGQYTQAPEALAKSEAVSKAVEQAPDTSASRNVGSTVFKKVAPGVVLVVNGDFIGAGAVLDHSGLIITNHHVVAGADAVSVIFMPPPGVAVESAKAYDATVERIDVIADLALIRVKNPPADMTLVALGDPSSVEVGEEVNAIGHPEGEFWSYTRGYVSQIRPKYDWYDSHYDHTADVIQTQTPINPGNSGGPLLDDGGRLIGINSFVDSRAQGLNYAVSVAEVTRVMLMKGDRLADGSVIEASDDTDAEPESNKVQSPTGAATNADYQTWAYDDNGDGKPDRWGVDLDKDGKPDLYLVDQDGDGKADFGLVDRNEDGKPEARIIYGDKAKGECDVWEIDENEDGKTDAIGMDYDYDGKPDVVRPE